MAEQKARHVIPKKHLYRAAFNWETWVQCCYNYERMMGMACGHTFVPVIDDLYKDDPDGAAKRKEVMEREMECPYRIRFLYSGYGNRTGGTEITGRTDSG